MRKSPVSRRYFEYAQDDPDELVWPDQDLDTFQVGSTPAPATSQVVVNLQLGDILEKLGLRELIIAALAANKTPVTESCKRRIKSIALLEAVEMGADPAAVSELLCRLVDAGSVDLESDDG